MSGFHEKNFYGTPEHYLTSTAPTDYGNIDIDALSCALSRAESICILLGANFCEDNGVRHNDDVLRNATWALEGAINQAQMILWGGRTTDAPKHEIQGKEASE